MLNKLRDPLKPLVDLISYPFSWLHPNIITLLSPIFALPGFYFYSQGNELLGTLFILGALTDMIDGAVAKLKSKGTRFGGVLDATVDRLFEGFLFFSIGVGELVSWELLFVAYIFSIGISYIKAKAEAASGEIKVGTNKFSVGIAQRGERILLIFFASIVDHFVQIEGKPHIVLEYTFFFLLASAIVTIIWRALIIWKVLGKK